MKKTRWVLNTITGNVKHWNPNMIGIDNIVECDENGTPLELLAQMRRLEASKPKRVPGVIKAKVADDDADDENVVDGDNDVDDTDTDEDDGDDEDAVEMAAEAVSTDEKTDEEREADDKKVEHTNRIQKLMLFPRDSLVAMAKTKGIRVPRSKANAQKMWFAEQIATYDETILQEG